MKKYYLKDSSGNYYKDIDSRVKDYVVTTKNKDEAQGFEYLAVAEDFMWFLSAVHDHKFDLEES